MSENRHVAFDTELCGKNPEAASDRIAELEEALKTVLASLVATTSILIRAEHSKCRPSRAVGSEELADWVRDHIGQYSWSITTPDETIYYSEIPKNILDRK